MDISKLDSVAPAIKKRKPHKPARPHKEQYSSITDSFRQSPGTPAPDKVLDPSRISSILLGNEQIGGERIQWKVNLARDYIGNGPLVGSDGTVYAGVDLSRMVALDASTGDPKWTIHTRIFHSSPVQCSDGTVVFYGGERVGDYCLYGVEPSTGKRKWRVEFDEWGISPLTIGPDDTVYLGRESTREMIALDGKTGREKWKTTQDKKVASSALGPGGTLFVKLEHDGKINALSAKSGKKKYDLQMEGWGYNMLCTPDGNLCFTDTSGGAFAVDGKTGKKKWDSPGPNCAGMIPYQTLGKNGTVLLCRHQNGISALDGKSGQVNWDFNPGSSSSAAPVEGPDGTVYAACHNKKLELPAMGAILYALDGTTGEKKWEIWFNSLLQHMTPGPDNSLIVDDDKGNVYSIICDDKKLAEKMKQQAMQQGSQGIADEEEVVNISGVRLKKKR